METKSAPSTEDDPRLIEAELAVARALNEVNAANRRYKQACTALGHLKVDLARERGHPWEGYSVWRSVESVGRKKLQRGVVTFKSLDMPDYGNKYIIPGRFFVLTDNKLAMQLDETWQLELL